MHWACKQKAVRTPTKYSTLPTKMHLRLQAYRYCNALPSKMQRASKQNAACFQAKRSVLPSKMQHGLKKNAVCSQAIHSTFSRNVLCVSRQDADKYFIKEMETR
jgi:hypothetical protein